MIASLYHEKGYVHLLLEDVVAIRSMAEESHIELSILMACNECPIVVRTSPVDAKKFIEEYFLHHGKERTNRRSQ